MPLFDRKDKSRYAAFTRRTLMMSGGITAAFTILAGRLYYLQILNGDQYMTQAEDNRINERLLAPPRGRILDRFGVELANNRRNYRVLLVAEQTDDVERALDSISKIIAMTDAQKKRVLRDIAGNKRFVPVPVAENLSWEEFARVNLHLPYLPGVLPDVGQTRDYPYGTEMSHILGYVAAVTAEEKKTEQDDPLFDLPGYRTGKRGIEKEFDEQVRGQGGTSRVEVNAYGRVMREISKESGIPGKDVYLTIDCALQRFADQRLGNESAACVVMDVETGDVLSLSSTPGYDPNQFNVGITPDQWKYLTTNDHKPLLNKVLGGTYPAGSTFKCAVAVAAVEAGVAKPGYSVYCDGSYTLGNHDFHCWKHGGHGSVDLKKAIQQSCDVFFYETARRIGIDKIEEVARKLGLGAPTGIDLPGERAGLIPSRAWKEATFGVPWQQGETLNTGIGQGYVTVTPIQLCTMTARIASGKAVSPRIARVVGDSMLPHPLPEGLPFSEEALAAVREGMFAVTNEGGGTAYTWRITEPGFEMCGKTGTAQVRRITREERASGVRSNQSLPWKLRDHALFVAYAPADKPRYACAVIVEHGAIGHPQCEMARDILLYAQKRDTLGLPAAYPVKAASLPQSGASGGG
jgi:penicillin-binding protein 2